MNRSSTPKVYQEFIDAWASTTSRQDSIDAYAYRRQSFVANLLPEQAVQLTTGETLDILRRRFGDAVDLALAPAHTDPEAPPETLPRGLRSPVADQPNGAWLKQTNIVGINVRTVSNFWNIVKYALTLPDAQNAIHILPIWEPGVAGSIYGLISWNLNPEFYSHELAEARPWLDSLAHQLRAVVNLLHVMGKCAGMDVIPHTDRFSQIALAFPEYFEWLRRQDTRIISHRANLHEEVQERIAGFLQRHGPAVAGDPVPETLFAPHVGEAQRMRLLFGLPKDPEGRASRRNLLIRHLYRYGYEPVPATMAPPFRGIAVDTRPEARNVDAEGQVWRDFVITHPQPMSRVFGPLGRYKLYACKDDNAAWEFDFDQPRQEVWEYVCRSYHDVQRRFGFDFMRGDMSHVQMRPEGVPAARDDAYDILGAVKTYIHQQGAPYFGYFAEGFLAPRDVMGYGEEMDHLEAARADATLGDLQSMVVGTEEFLGAFRRYCDQLETRACAPAFTVMTADKDDPRFDAFYVGGSETRLFIALFLTSMPSYMGLGFETRDVHYGPAPNEHYTKLYVFQLRDGPKATHGPYVWGKNGYLFNALTRLRQYADAIWPRIQGHATRWLLPPDATGHNKVVAWTQTESPTHVFVANTAIHETATRFGLPALPGFATPPGLHLDFTTEPGGGGTDDRTLPFNGKHYRLTTLAPGEGRVYRVQERE
ncbi:MAG: hypothetical protein JXB35_00190 [Anaerolineae bacterium]|nr:hypothetical protein [Anaerolineae bacterium]